MFYFTLPVLCEASHKVGKSSSTVNLGVGLALQGKKVCLIDADPQGDLTTSLGWPDNDSLSITLATLMEKIINDEPIDPQEGILHHTEGVDLVPANRELSGMEIALVGAMSQEFVLKSYPETMKLEAMKRQTGRPSNNYVPVGHNFDGKPAREILADNSPDSNTQIQRYIRLTELAPPLLNMVDDGQIAMRPAVELSYIPQEQQDALREVIKAEDRVPSYAQAAKLRKLSGEGRLTNDTILSAMKDEKPKHTGHFKLPGDRIQHFFPAGTPAQAIEDTTIKALELWQKNQ